MPDTINPQNLNRFSYVLNNPLKYTDPSGHAQCRTYEDCEDMGTTPMGSGNGGPNKGNQGNNQDDNECTSVVCLPTPTPELPVWIPSLGQPQPQMGYPNLPDIFQQGGELFGESFNILHFLAENGRYPYRLIRSLTVNPIQEATISASLQLVADGNNNLTIFQRAGRVTWTAIEAAAIDILSAPIIAGSTTAGALVGSPTDGILPIGEAAGASTGYVIGAVASNSIMTSASDKWVTPWIYRTFQLYDPHGN